MAYRRKQGISTTIARIFNTDGPRMALNDGRVVPAFLDQALRGEELTVFGDGSQTRSFCYVSDLVEGLLRLIDSNEPYPVNLGNPNEMTILDFAHYIRDKVGNNVGIQFRPLPSDDPKIRRPDITKAKRVLGWEPQVTLEQGIQYTVEHFRERIFPALVG
jgi:dTDP-glucose 4,6-dehydratase